MRMIGLCGRYSYESLASEDERESYGLPKEVDPSVHGVQLIADFNPVDHTLEPTEKDNPVKCPQPQPCILHDGRMLKERMLKERLQEANSGRIAELPIIKEDRVQLQGSHRRSHWIVSDDTILNFSE